MRSRALVALLSHFSAHASAPLVTGGVCGDACQQQENHIQLLHKPQPASGDLYLHHLLQNRGQPQGQQGQPLRISTDGIGMAPLVTNTLHLRDEPLASVRPSPPPGVAGSASAAEQRPFGGSVIQGPLQQQHLKLSEAVSPPPPRPAVSTQAVESTAAGAAGHQPTTEAAGSSVSTVSGLGRCQPFGPGPGLACLNPASGEWEKVRWFGPWAYDPDSLRTIGEGLRAGKLVHIQNALSEHAAEALHRELWSITDWSVEVKASPEIQFKRHTYLGQGPPSSRPPVLDAFHTYLHNEKDFWGRLARFNMSFWQKTAFGTWFRQGDFLSPHTDDTHKRDLAFNLAMTKEWDVSWGGAFWWLKDTNIEHSPKFNNLYIFVPTSFTQHMVSTVLKEGDTHRRLSINGWFVGSEFQVGTLSDG